MWMRTSRHIRWLPSVVFLFGTSALGQDAPSIVEVAGRVADTSGKAIENAVVEAVGTDVSPVLTDAAGKYKFYLVGQERRFSLRVSKGGYTPESSQPMAPERRVAFDKILKRYVPRDIKVVMEDFVSGVSISGKVSGLQADQIDTHKVLVYVLTDKWYLHPYARNEERKGYSSITADGSWSLDTVNRRDHPFKLSILVVPEDYTPPTPIPVGEDAEQSLRAKVGVNLVALEIMKAPEGL